MPKSKIAAKAKAANKMPMKVNKASKMIKKSGSRTLRRLVVMLRRHGESSRPVPLP